MSVFSKDPEATLDYSLDWSEWLTGGDLIDTAVWTLPAGVTAAQSSTVQDGLIATVWVSGGTAGSSYELTCRVTTVLGRVEDHTITLNVRGH